MYSIVVPSIGRPGLVVVSGYRREHFADAMKPATSHEIDSVIWRDEEMPLNARPSTQFDGLQIARDICSLHNRF